MIAEFIDPAYLGFILVGVMLFAIFVGFPISFTCLLYTSPSPRDAHESRMPSSA